MTLTHPTLEEGSGSLSWLLVETLELDQLELCSPEQETITTLEAEMAATVEAVATMVIAVLSQVVLASCHSCRVRWLLQLPGPWLRLCCKDIETIYLFILVMTMDGRMSVMIPLSFWE